MNNLKRPNSHAETPAQAMKSVGIMQTRKANAVSALHSTTGCELGLMGYEQSTKITIQITNNNAANIVIPFGTPLGIVGEVPFYPNLAPSLGLVPWQANLGDLVDNQGINATFLQALNLRFVRNPVYVSHMEVITPDTALGQAQRQESVTYLVIPYNSVNDGRTIQGSYKSVYTEWTGGNVFDERGVIFSDFTGALYTLLAGSTASFNIYLQGVNVPTFKHNYTCN